MKFDENPQVLPQVDGSVVTWGAGTYGGEPPLWPPHTAVRSIRATEPWQSDQPLLSWKKWLAEDDNHGGIYGDITFWIEKDITMIMILDNITF